MTTKAATKRERIEAIVAAIEASGLGMTKADHPLVFRKETEWGSVIFYPNSSKWQHRGKTLSGSVEEFKSWMQTKGFA